MMVIGLGLELVLV